MADAKIGAVTVLFNSGKVLDGFMESMLAQTHRDFILYVVDNDSKDDSLAKLARYRDDRIVLIDNKVNYGVAKGNNQGIEAARKDGCSHVLLINNDTEFESELFAKLLSGMAEHACDMLVPKMMFYQPADRIWFAGGRFRPWLAYQEEHWGEGETDRGQYDAPKTIAYAPTCCMLLRNSVFDRIGLMDEKYFVYYDDTDFCLRAYRAGLKMVYISGMRFHHKVNSLTGGAKSPFAVRYMTRNKVYFIRKNMPALSLPLWLFVYQLYLVSRIFREYDFKTFILKEISFMEGMRL